MAKELQRISIRLLRDDKKLSDEEKLQNSVRDGVQLNDWDKLVGAKIAFGTIGGNRPGWSEFLGLEDDTLSNTSAYCLVFVFAAKRWFVASFGAGHLKLNLDAFEQGFGLRVVLNTVDPDKLRSIDVQTLDENITYRRTQTARCADQTAFGIDIDCDIMRGLVGAPEDPNFASRVEGSDVLMLTKEMEITDLPQVCADAFAAYGDTKYRDRFAWIDNISHVRDKWTIVSLNTSLVKVLDHSLKDPTSSIPGTLSLAYPVIYDTEKAQYIRYRGFGCSKHHADLDIEDYVSDMRDNKKLSSFKLSFLNTHKVHEVDDNGKDDGQRWPIRKCLIYETYLEGEKYVLSADRWYRVDRNLATKVSRFFKKISRNMYSLPPALADENEEQYNERIAKGNHGMLCLDGILVKPTGASRRIEACDFLGEDGAMIHIKNRTSSSRLSHLFNQGTISARVMKTDGAFRELLLEKIEKQQAEHNKIGYEALVADSKTPFREGKHLVVYGIICAGACAGTKRQLPFFSLVTFQQAVAELRALGYRCAFAWIYKPLPSGKTKAQPKAKAKKWEAQRKSATTTETKQKPEVRRQSAAIMVTKWKLEAQASPMAAVKRELETQASPTTKVKRKLETQASPTTLVKRKLGAQAPPTTPMKPFTQALSYVPLIEIPPGNAQAG